MADLAELARRAGDAGIFTDFDGSLSPIVPDPADARPLRGAGRVLSDLARRFRAVAVVSGRSAADLASRIEVTGVHLVGLHGMEALEDGRVRVLPEAEPLRAAVDDAHAELRARLRGVRGAIIEHKGLIVAVHFRRAPSPDEAEQLAAPEVAEIAARHDLMVVPGRRILEVRPRSGGDKGDAVRAIVERHGLRAGLFAGDDAGDLPAFSALDELDVAVRIAVVSDESPPELAERADLVVESPAALLALLRRLAS